MVAASLPSGSFQRRQKRLPRAVPHAEAHQKSARRSHDGLRLARHSGNTGTTVAPMIRVAENVPHQSLLHAQGRTTMNASIMVCRVNGTGPKGMLTHEHTVSKAMDNPLNAIDHRFIATPLIHYPPFSWSKVPSTKCDEQEPAKHRCFNGFE